MTTRIAKILVALLAAALPVTLIASPADALTSRKSGETQKDF